jgi:nucleoside-diphosphate-sugar epimerase
VRVFLAGATGAIGRPLVARLLAKGHEVIGSTRSPERARQLEQAGASAVVLDALDREAVIAAVSAAAPQAVIHELTALPQRIDPRKMVRDFALNDRLRTEGTQILLDAAAAAGAKRILTQSIAFTYAPGPPGTVHPESDPLMRGEDTSPTYARSADALRELERLTLRAGGLVLRYGYFYGTGTAICAEGSIGREMRRGRMPIVGGGGGVWSFIHIEDAAAATLAALTEGAPGAYNIVDDDPAPVRDWIPALADALGARRPMRVPALIARPLAGSYGVYAMTAIQGARNEKAKQALNWTPEHPSWRKGFTQALG